MSRKIIHIDCDCFYAAVEVRDNPKLSALPVAVGGRSDRRGVIATCNYEARDFGIHSAMSSSRALTLCPQLILLPVRMDVYRKVSQSMHRVFKQYTDLIEPLSLDEAYLDVTDCEQHNGSATWIAQSIRDEVKQSLGITVSAGIASNKLLAKVASDWNKPNGQCVILPDEVDDFMMSLPVKKIPGVGKVTERKMNGLGVKTCGDLQAFDVHSLTHHFGMFGQRLYSLCRGQDDRLVQATRTRKSISVETTFNEDLTTPEQCVTALPSLIDKLTVRSDKHFDGGALDSNRIKSMFVKLKFSDFTTTTIEGRVAFPLQDGFVELIKKGMTRNNKSIRLIGVGVRLKTARSARSRAALAHDQLELF
ncbi:MAG: DNA polymerase IV [Pseudomonadota bacterium]